MLALVIALACHREPTPLTMPATPVERAPTAPPQVRANQLARGDYVAAIAGCTTCHGHDLAGGAGVPNITNDSATGIGTWSDDDIISAIRRGVRPDDSRLAPVMPYPFYSHMTDADAVALVTYMRAQTPIRKLVVRDERLAIAPIDVAAPSGNVDRTDDAVSHGAYIAALMHCGACHTSREPSQNLSFAGGTQFVTPSGTTVVAANITSDRDTGIGAYDEADIIRAVREMKDPAGHDLRAPMAMYKEAWSRLADDDAHALAMFVQSVQPVRHPLTASRRP